MKRLALVSGTQLLLWSLLFAQTPNFQLEAISPNPFGDGGTRIRYQLGALCRVNLRMEDAVVFPSELWFRSCSKPGTTKSCGMPGPAMVRVCHLATTRLTFCAFHLPRTITVRAENGNAIWAPSRSVVQAFYSNISGGWEGEGNIDADPAFGDPGSGDFRLRPESPNIDAGTALLVVHGDTLVQIDSDDYLGAAPDMGAFEFDGTTGVVGNAGLPGVFRLEHNFPNPFNPETTIYYQLPTDLQLRLEVFNLIGQRVAVLVDAEQRAGSHSVQWHGRDEAGRDVASGLYIYRLRTASFVASRKMLLLR